MYVLLVYPKLTNKYKTQINTQIKFKKKNTIRYLN